jgi:hypothetical protein
MYDEDCWDGYKEVGMKKKGNKMVPNCVAEENELLENWVTDLMHKIGAKTINKNKYTKVARHIKKELDSGRYKAGSADFAAADTARKFGLDIDVRVLANMIREL